MPRLRAAVLIALLAAPLPVRGGVVINEVLYHAPNDLDNLQFIELFNPGDRPIDLAGWKLAGGISYVFPAGRALEANGYLVVCKDVREFRKQYGFEAAGAFTGSLARGAGTIELVDASGRTLDRVRYRSRAPWPVAADGHGPSLERLCSTASGDGPDNWVPSALPAGAPRPGGTPGKRNSSTADHLPPVITNVTLTPQMAAPGQEVTVEADVRSGDGVRGVELRYRVAGPGFEGPEQTVVMAPAMGNRYRGVIPGQKANHLLRARVRAVDARGEARVFPHDNDLRPALSAYVHEPFKLGKVPLGFVINVGRHRAGGFFGFGAPPAVVPARGPSAYVHVDARTGKPQLFDFISVTPRNGGHKVRFHKDQTLDGMTVINLIFESLDRFVLAEPLAYEVYRRAGNVACRTDFVRLTIDGRPLGYQLLVEQPNKAFLRHNGLRTDGNLYKLLWYGHGLVGQHEKKTNPGNGHDDLIRVVNQLNRTRGDEQWAVIKKNFDVEQVINYFAVNQLLSHWDGYFNNYFTYHDLHGTGKWTIYPWDQDKTWGFHDGIQGYDVFYDMPLTFGMNGDVPRGGSIWWRPPGHFSGPLLANPTFRRLFLARLRDLLDTVYTEKVFFPLIQQMGERLQEEVAIRAELHGQNPRQAQDHLRRNLESLRQHLVKRRGFLLEQEEIMKAGKFDRTELK